MSATVLWLIFFAFAGGFTLGGGLVLWGWRASRQSSAEFFKLALWSANGRYELLARDVQRAIRIWEDTDG